MRTKTKYKLVAFYMALFIPTTLNAQDIPKNAWKSGNTWFCNDGYKKEGNECIKFRVPKNAWVSGSNWYCNDGYRKEGNECIKFRVPNNAWVSGSNWYCNDGFRKKGNECVKFNIPANAFAIGSEWYCNEGYKKQDEICIRMSQDELNTFRKKREVRKKSLSDGTIAFQTKIDDESGDIIKLENGAIVEISSYFGYLGYRKNVVLYGSGHRCNIWIAGKKSYKCELLKTPGGRGEPAKEVHISEVKGNGTILKMLDGSIYEVDVIDEIHTTLWLGISDGLLINGTTLINFDADEAVTVHRIK